ncbi:hypothetical protein F4778DRAFT_782609 [Xylariomycetidae sp. FL2044]|nr:hypothetical protein F4778DRAFT_782609 [Xylariomycetidae sp. FL2044]
MTRVTLSFLASAIPLWAAGLAAASCNADNCYRALFACRAGKANAFSTATEFCATITQGPGRTATNLPTEATPFCGTTADRFLSACSCGPTCFPAPTGTPCPGPTNGNLVPNGDFECGIAPWVVQVPDPAARYSLAGPAYSGQNAFQVKLTGPPANQEYGIDARILSQPLPVARGARYRLSFWSYFSDELCRPTFIGFMVNDGNDAIGDVGASDHDYNAYHYNELEFTAKSDSVRIKFEWALGPDVCTASVDTVALVRVN